MKVRTAFILVIAIAIVATFADRAGHLGWIRDAASSIILPLATTAGGVTRPVLSVFTPRPAEAGDTKALGDVTAQLNAALVRINELESENRRLRSELGFKESHLDTQFQSANVIYYDPSNFVRTVTIDKGTSSGLRVGMVVVSPAGLVGRITQTSANTSRVMLINDSRSSLYAVVQRSDTRALGIVQGRLGDDLGFRFVPQAETISPGDLVVTSGRGLSFPQGLFVGKIKEVRRNDVEMFQEAVIEPAVDFTQLEAVMVITSFLPATLPAS